MRISYVTRTHKICYIRNPLRAVTGKLPQFEGVNSPKETEERLAQERKNGGATTWLVLKMGTKLQPYLRLRGRCKPGAHPLGLARVCGLRPGLRLGALSST